MVKQKRTDNGQNNAIPMRYAILFISSYNSTIFKNLAQTVAVLQEVMLNG
jgi:hypothetical protein